MNGWQHWKMDKNQLWGGKRSQKGQRKIKSRRIRYWCGWGRKKSEMLQKMGDTWPWKCESPRGRLQRWPKNRPAKITSKIAHLQNRAFRSVRGSDSCHIADQPLYFHWMTLSKAIRWVQEGVLHRTVAPRPHIRPEIARSALSVHPTVVTLATNHSIFPKWPWVKLLGLKRRFLHHKVAPRPQRCLELGKETPRQKHPENSTFRSVRGSDICYIG